MNCMRLPIHYFYYICQFIVGKHCLVISLLIEKYYTLNKKCQNALDSGLGTSVTPLLEI